MIKTTTNDDLIRCYYNETSAEEDEKIINDISGNPSLENFWKDLNDVGSKLEIKEIEPSRKSISNILFYSKMINFAPID